VAPSRPLTAALPTAIAVPANLMPLVVAQLRALTLAPLLYLAIVAVVAAAAVFSTKTGRRRAALAVLRVLVPQRINPGGPGVPRPLGDDRTRDGGSGYPGNR
jgi:hypothetical protein